MSPFPLKVSNFDENSDFQQKGIDFSEMDALHTETKLLSSSKKYTGKN